MSGAVPRVGAAREGAALDTAAFDGIAFAATPAAPLRVLVRATGSAVDLARCLRSLCMACPAADAEVVVVDDGAGEAVMAAAAAIPGVTICAVAAAGGIRAALNACTAAAQTPFILFLEDHAELAAEAVQALVARLRADPGLGAAGARLVGPDGRLRQAGAVVWSDGSSCSHGRGDAPDAPGYAFARDVDHCSTEVLLLRRDAVVGHPVFDGDAAGTAFADAGLGFALRRRGWRFGYAARARAIVHRDIARARNVGEARATALAERAFRQAWARDLATQFAPCQRMFRARERTAGRRIVLVVDHYLPDPERDAGSRAIMQTMQALQRMGSVVKFWPANQAYPAGQGHALEEAGIEVLAGDRWAGRFERFIRHAGAELDVVLLSRPDVAHDTLPLVRAHSAARIVYYGHDLHHRRMQLQARVTGGPRADAAAEAMRVLEESVWRGVDAVVYPSDDEAAVAAAQVGAGRAHAVPLYAFDDSELSAPRQPDPGAHLLFVAGFGHSPNVDAAQWLVAEVLPHVQAQCPGTTLDLVGSNPTEEVRALGAAAGVRVIGNVSGAELADRYRRASLAVVPVRFGAGVKLKVLEAMARGVPVVTTPVGVQGMPGVDACIHIAGDAAGMAAAIGAMLRDPGAASARTDAARDYVRRHYGADAMQAALRRVLGDA